MVTANNGFSKKDDDLEPDVDETLPDLDPEGVPLGYDELAEGNKSDTYEDTDA